MGHPIYLFKQDQVKISADLSPVVFFDNDILEADVRAGDADGYNILSYGIILQK